MIAKNWSQLIAYVGLVLLAVLLFYQGQQNDARDRRLFCQGQSERIALIEDIANFAAQPIVPPLSEQLKGLGPEVTAALRKQEQRSDEFRAYIAQRSQEADTCKQQGVKY